VDSDSGSGLVVGAGPGRGAWLCADHPVECLDRALRRRAVTRALRAEVAGGDVERLRAKLVSTETARRSNSGKSNEK
jgi:predicted RNA-binding protein YlxR (DUF448 family)